MIIIVVVVKYIEKEDRHQSVETVNYLWLAA